MATGKEVETHGKIKGGDSEAGKLKCFGCDGTAGKMAEGYEAEHLGGPWVQHSDSAW